MRPTIDACRGGVRPRRLKVEHRNGKITETISTALLEQLAKQHGLSIEVRPDWYAINHRCSAPGCARAVARVTAWRALARGYMPKCKPCWKRKAGPPRAPVRSASWILDEVRRLWRHGLDAAAIAQSLAARRIHGKGSTVALTIGQVEVMLAMVTP